MPTKEDVLVKQTYKDQGLDVGVRVFYTLIGEPDSTHREKLQANRTSKAVALLFKMLRESGALTDAQVDEILLDVIS